jgi:hypothetical protein
VRRIIGPATQICGLAGGATDGAGRIYVTNACNVTNSLTVYSATAGSSPLFDNQAPLFTLGGGTSSPFLNPQQIAFDGSGNLYVTNFGCIGTTGQCPNLGSIVVYGPITGSGQAPIATISGSPICRPSGLAFDPGGHLVVLNDQSGSDCPQPTLVYFSAGAPSTIKPTKVVTSSALSNQLFDQIAIDASGNVFVNEFFSIVVFSPNAGTNATPIAQLSLPAPGSLAGTGVAVPVTGTFGQSAVRRVQRTVR